MLFKSKIPITYINKLEFHSFIYKNTSIILYSILKYVTNNNISMHIQALQENVIIFILDVS